MILARGQGLGVIRGGKTLLEDVDVELQAGELTAVVGPNGAGKSTLLRVLSGELAADRGRVVAFEQCFRDWEPRALARRRAVVAQHVHVAFPWTVRDLVALGRLPHDTSRATNDRAVDAALALVHMTDFARRSSSDLSGGELQRVHFARAIAQLDGSHEAILLLDEPTASLDPAHQHQTLRLARSMARAGHAVLCILHDLALAARYADRALVLAEGRAVGQGAAADILSARLLANVFKIRTMRHTDPATDETALFVLGPIAEEEAHP